jgi:putative Ca2+/H+ antiporter (TMEM165/GDT1 family)
VKLDSAPLDISSRSQTEIELELEDSIDSKLTTATLSEPVQPLVTDSPQKQQSAAVIFGTTFITIFLAEIGDKTQLSTLLMSAESHSPWTVFMGSAAALVTTSLLAVLLGSWIASRLSPKIVEKSAGVMLLLISLMLFWDVFQG